MFTQPKQGADGRYNARVVEPKFVQVNGVTIEGKFTDSDTVTLDFADADKISAVDQMVVDAAKDNSETWFGKKVPDKTLEAGYTGSLKSNKMFVDKIREVRAFNSDRTILALEDIPADITCDVIIEFVGVSFFKKTYSPVWKIVQVKLRPEPNRRQKYTDECMFEDPEPEIEDEPDEDF